MIRYTSNQLYLTCTTIGYNVFVLGTILISDHVVCYKESAYMFISACAYMPDSMVFMHVHACMCAYMLITVSGKGLIMRLRVEYAHIVVHAHHTCAKLVGWGRQRDSDD